MSAKVIWFKRVIDLLLTDFFPDEPCAAGLDLCPPGYRIPALEDDIKNILSRGWSFLAEDMDQVVGVAICNVALFHLRNIMETLEDKEETNQEETVQDLEIPNEAIWDGRK